MGKGKAQKKCGFEESKDSILRKKRGADIQTRGQEEKIQMGRARKSDAELKNGCIAWHPWVSISNGYPIRDGKHCTVKWPEGKESIGEPKENTRATGLLWPQNRTSRIKH